MSEIISKWILNRLGLVVDMTPETFTVKTIDGSLISQLLHSYEIITTEELNLLKKSDNVNDCYENFILINNWLSKLHLNVPDEDIYEIVHGIGSASLHLFYQVFLELKDKTKLDFLTDNELNAQLGKRLHRFYVKTQEDGEDPNILNLHREGLCEPFLAGGNVYHWYKDREEALQTRCKEAREEYLHNIKSIKAKSYVSVERKGYSDRAEVFQRALDTSSRVLASTGMKYDDDLDSLDTRTYEDLIKLQNQIKEMPEFKPDPKEAQRILKKLHTKNKQRQENKVFRNQLHQEIMNEFERKMNSTKSKSEDQVLINIFLKQSLYEKELVTKLGQVKMEKEYIIENRLKQSEILNKLKEKDFLDALVLKDKETSEKKLMYYLERERILQLHEKLFKEKERLKKQRSETLCTNALNDIIDISLKISEYQKQHKREPSRREIANLKDLFVTGQPIFDICQPVIDIIKDEIIEEQILTKEISRQCSIDQEEFEKYQNYEWPWDWKHLDSFNGDLMELISEGLNVLGYIVHRALENKYPIVRLWEEAKFPNVSTRVCIHGLNDTSILPSLRNLLAEKSIKVIELSQAVDYCLEAYRLESIREIEEADDVSLKEKSKKEPKVPKIKKGEKSLIKKPIRNLEEFVASESLKETEHKKVQTPLKFPCEEIAYSHQAQLGRTAQELLDEGQSLGDFLLIDMFIEYLKSIPDLKGWVLVNYPTNFQQAVIIEEALTGLKLIDPITLKINQKSLMEIMQIDEKDNCSLYEDFDKKRISKLLPNPITPKPLEIYDTKLTAFINMKKLNIDDKIGDSTLPPIYEQLSNNTDPLEKFYSDVGVNYSLYYKELDWGTIKYLGKLIIGDFSLPLKTSSELFGEIGNLDSKASKSVKATKVGDKLKKPKPKLNLEPAADAATKEITPAKVGKNKKEKTKFVIFYADKSVQMPTEDEEEEYLKETDLESVGLKLPGPGQIGWVYSESVCPEELLNALGTLWETEEEIYMNDMKQLFFLKRLNLNSIMPFAQYMKDCMRKTIHRPDNKSMLLSKFQNAFNAFEMDFRKDDEFKAEMYCRIEDFKEKLSEMCDLKMMESENMRLSFINADWAPRQIKELLNNYVTVLQIELDRFIESIRFINDYYTGIMTNLPTEEELYKEDAMSKIKEISTDYINKMFQDSTSNVEINYFEELLNFVIQKMQNSIKRIHGVAQNCLEKAIGNQMPTSNQKQLKTKTGSIKTKSKDSKKLQIESNVSPINDEFDKLVDEWRCAVKGETLRINLRIDLVKKRALESIEEFLKTIQNAFHEVFNEIRNKYWLEIENINKACHIFKQAVEKEIPLQKELIFDEHSFKINPEINLFDNEAIIPELPREVVQEGAFSLEQLIKLTDILLDLSPSGFIAKTQFIFILQDVIFNNMGPNLWKQLLFPEPSRLKRVMDAIFDDLEYLYWKDFIIYNLRMPFPSEREFLLTRKNLRDCDPDATELIQDYQFYATSFWFEYVYAAQDLKKIQDIKRLLFKMYYLKNYGVNYTAMLLDFCKDSNATEGFAKALELSLGKIICWDIDIGNAFEKEYVRRMQEHQENVRMRQNEIDDLYKATYEEITKVVDKIVRETDEVVIEDYKTSDEESSEKSVNLKTRRGSILKKCLKNDNAINKDKIEELRFRESIEVAQNSSPSTSNAESFSLKNSSTIKEEVQLILSDLLPDNVLTDCVESTELIFFLPLDVVTTVITAALPWHSRVQNYDELSFWEKATECYEKCRNPDFNMSVLSHEFLNSEMFQNLLKQTKKFCVIDPVSVVHDILSENI